MGRVCSTHGEKKNANRILVGKQEGKRPLGRPRRPWKNNIKMDLRKIGWGGMDGIYLVQDKERWRAFLETTLTLRFHKMFGNS
jgi:hypothetical protein